MRTASDRSPGPTGVVLCGGSSRRMGRDKALIGDPPWAHRVADALSSAGCDPVTLLGGDPALCHDRWDHRDDEQAGAGPGAALLDAARHAAPGPMVVAACDLPSLRPDDVRGLLERLECGSGAAAYRIGERAQWSLVALSGDVVADLAAAEPGPGVALGALLGPLAELCDPSDIASVTDLDRPLRNDPAGDPPRHGRQDS